MSLNVKKLKNEKHKWDNFKTIMRMVELNEINKLFKMKDTFNNNLVHFYEQKKLMKKIEADLSLAKKTKFFSKMKEKKSSKEIQQSKYLYIIMSPKKTDSTSKAKLRKMEEYLNELDKEKSYFVTFGHEANKMCNRLELKIVDSFKEFKDGSLENESVSKIVAISSLSIINFIFEEVNIVYPEISNKNGELFSTKILPFGEEKQEFSEEFSEAEELIEKRASSLSYDGNIRQMQ